MKPFLARIVIFSLFFISTWCIANTSTYETKLPVPDQTEPAKRKAIHQALSEILVKNSGDPKILSHKEIQSILAKAHDYIQSYQYFNERKRGSWQKFIHITFNKEDIDRIIQHASTLSFVSVKPPQATQLPVTPTGTQKLPIASKPTLVWLAVKNSPEDKPVLTEFQQDNVISKLLESTARQKHIALFLPELDVEDITLATPENIWKLDKSILNEASDRYGSPNILAGRLLKTENHQWEGKWLFKHNMEWTELETTGATPESNLSTMLETFRGKIGTMPPESIATLTTTPTESSEKFLIQVYQIDDLDKSNQLLQYLGQLKPVKYIDTISVQRDSVILEIKAKGGPEAFQQAIEQEGKLLPTTVLELDPSQPEDAATQPQVDLQYDWQEPVHPTSPEH